MLISRGHQLVEFFRHSDEIRYAGAFGTLKGATATPWNPFSAAAIRRIVKAEKPDIVHVHNTFPLISPSIFTAVGGESARVLTLHNYRLFCPAAIPLRRGLVCTQCIDKGSVWPSLKYGCYRDSRLATLPVSIGVSLHRGLGTWKRQVDAFIVTTDFQRQVMVEAGLPESLVHIKPNFFPGSPDLFPWEAREPVVVFVGRLSPEKGLESLLTAWLQWGESAPELRIIGEGILREKLEKMALRKPSKRIRFLGYLPNDLTQREIRQSRLLIVPSECYEGFPMVIGEAFALGTPAAVSQLGPLPSIVEHGGNGLVFKPGNPQSLLSVVSSAWNVDGLLEGLGKGARGSYELRYTEAMNYRELMGIYAQAREISRARSPE